MNLTDYSDKELELMVMNTESLYNMRFTLTRQLLSDMGISHTQQQWEVLAASLMDEIYDEAENV